MRIPRVFVDNSLLNGETLSLSKEASGYVSRVLRLRAGDSLHLFNNTGGYYCAEIINLGKRVSELKVGLHVDDDRESRLNITLAQGISRGQHMDITIQKSVELGVSRIVPIITEYSNVRLNQERTDQKLNHWKKICISACEQCGRNVLPEIMEPLTLTNWLEQDVQQQKILLNPEANKSLTKIPKSTEIILLSGPEGGFSDFEIEQAMSKGYQSVQLGPRILRTETAGPTAIAICQSLWGDLA